MQQVHGRTADFNVLLTSYDFMMGKHDRPRLAKLTWEYIIIDEGHRLKNAGCKLNAEIKMYNAGSRLLLTGAHSLNSCFSDDYAFTLMLPACSRVVRSNTGKHCSMHMCHVQLLSLRVDIAS